MPFGECTITLQDVAYQLGLPIDGEPVSGCLTDFESLMKHGRPTWVWFRELFGELPPQNKVKQMTVCYTWFHERSRVLPADASEETVRIYARAYILMLLSSQLFADKNANRVHLCWLPYLASLDELGRYSWGTAALAWWATYLSRNDVVGERVMFARLSLDRLRVHDFVWEPYSSVEVVAVIHSEILVDEHRRLWTAITSLIYFAAIEWHQVDRVLPQFGGVQHLPQPALNIDWLHAKDDRGGDRWFPKYFQEWHEHWENRLYLVIPVDRVLDPGPSAEYLDWWCRVAHRFLFPEVAFQDLRPIVLIEEARHRRSSQAPSKVQDQPAANDEDVVDYRVPRRRARRHAPRDGRGRARGGGPSVEDEGTQHGVRDDVGGSASGMDQPTYDVGSSSQLFGSFEPQAFAEFTTAAVGMDIDDPVSQSEFFRNIADMLRDDDATHYRPQMPKVHSEFADQQPPIPAIQPQLAVDLNEPASSPSDPWFALGGTPALAFSVAPRETAAPETAQRPRRVRRPPCVGPEVTCLVIWTMTTVTPLRILISFVLYSRPVVLCWFMYLE
ncbi:serine/threonine-protein phosphatase 7 long form homolog [Arachis duranensis]|uniref:Serine/threonine-protein phosphatase 7 long form homolog n=1 Tax=Arachis duranensis TaxID=130453 RepID=A0A6P4BYP4_ARADU|nr:serine/threonine-protein phosphatase 7 long form homolog [Arachis duranensis]